MSTEYSKSSHTIHDIKYHIIWVTKYRYKVLGGNLSIRLRELIRQSCEARNITIVQYLKGRSSRLLQEEFPELKKRYWGQHLWGRGYFCTTVGSVTEETIRKYIENQELSSNNDIFKIDE